MFKKGFEFSFTWLFALSVGAIIIFLAIYASRGLIKTGTEEYNTKVAAELGVLLNPIGTNLESSKHYSLALPDETRLFNDCSSDGAFGLQKLSVSVRSGIGQEWPKAGIPHKFANKYVFSQHAVQGKELELFVKPFNFPFKVGDLIILYSTPFCFVAPPSDVEREVNFGDGARYINVTTSKENCPMGSVSVCFSGGTGCNITVIMNQDGRSGRVMKQGQPLFYYDALLYGAIVADKETYDCQVARLMKRTAELALLYAAKSELLSSRGCSSGLEGDLRSYAQHLSSNNLPGLIIESETLERDNEKLTCGLF